MTLVERIVASMDPEEVIDLLGISTARLVDALLEDILEERETFETHLEEV